MHTSKRVMKATVLSVLLLGATVLATTESRGESGKPLTPEQASAKAAFDAAIVDGVKGMKDDCGIDLAVTTDFESYDRSSYANPGGKGGDGGGKGGGGGGGAKKKEGDPGPEDWKRDQRNPAGPLRQHVNVCGQVIQRLARLCPKKRGASTPPLPEVKGVACLMGGVQPAQQDDRTNDQVQRNMSFSNGVLTVHIPPYGVPNVDDNVFLALMPLASKTDRMNGVQCTKTADCRSGVCGKGVCTACGPQAACSGATETCGTRGICFHKLTPEEVRERDAEEQRRDAAREAEPAKESNSSSNAKKGLGQKCQFNAECESKICGTLSSGSLHKCTNRH